MVNDVPNSPVGLKNNELRSQIARLHQRSTELEKALRYLVDAIDEDDPSIVKVFVEHARSIITEKS